MCKKQIALALTLMLLLVSAGIKAQTTVYLDQDFETCTAGSGNIPTGWNNQDYTPGVFSSSSMSSYLWYVNSSTADAHSGTKFAYLYCYYYYTRGSRLKTPVMNLSSTKDAKVSFWMKNQAAGKGDLSLYVSTDSGATYIQNPLDEHLVAGDTWTYYEYSLADYKGQAISLVFQGVSGSSATYYYYIDDIKVMDAPTCQAPADPYISNLTGNSATFNWGLDARFGVVPDQYSVTLKDAAGNVVYHNANVTASGVLFSNLQNNTTYTASVRSDCDARSYQGFSDSVSLVFNTLPNAVNPPMTVDFDDWTDIPMGYYYKNATLNTDDTYSYGNDGNSIKLTTSISDNAYFIFPLLNIAGNNIEMDFMLRRATAANATIRAIPFMAGYLTDPSDVEGGFVPVLIDSIAGDDSWRNIRFNTAATQDITTPVMCCVVIGNSYATSVFLDQMDIHTIPTCIRPEHVTITDVHANDVTISWDASNASSYIVRAMSLPDSTVTTMQTSQNPYTFSNLTPNTEYVFTVEGICSSTDSSQISYPVSVKTDCSLAEETTFFEGAESGSQMPDCWKSDYLVNVNYSLASPFQTSTTQKIGTRSFYIPSQPSGSISYLVSRQLDFDQSGKYSFRYQIYRPSGTSYANEGFKVFVSPNAGDTTNAVTVIPFINASAGNAPSTTTTGWNEYEGIINYQGTGYITIVMYHQNGIARYIDNLEVFLTPSCPKVTDITFNGTTTNSANISWTPGKNETQWLINYQVKMGTDVVIDTAVTTNSPSLTVASLQPATDYTVSGSVRAFCVVGDTADPVRFTFPVKTQCLPMTLLPFYYDFEDAAVGSTVPLPNCWSRFNDATGPVNYFPSVFGTALYAHSGTNSVYFSTSTTETYAEHQMLILPNVDITMYPINTLRLKFWAKRTATSSYGDAPMIIGAMTDPDDFSTFVAIDTATVSNTDHQEFIIPLITYTGTGSYVAIRLDRQSASCLCYMDDITLEVYSPCSDLVGSAFVDENTETSVRVSVMDTTATEGWSYAYGPAGTHVSQMTTADASGSSVVLNGLSSATAYDLYVRRKCDDGSYSSWSAVVRFFTTAEPAQIPYACGFEEASENDKWQFVEGAAVNMFAIGTDSTAVHSGTQSIYVSKDNGATNEYAITPSSRTFAYRTIEFGAKGYQIDFHWRCAGGQSAATTNDYGRVMLLPVYEVLPEGGQGTNITEQNPQADFPSSAIFLNPEEKGCMVLDGTEWHHSSYYVNMAANPGLYNLVLAWNNDVSVGTAAGPLAVDDISIVELSCVPPTTIYTANVSTNSATLFVSQQGVSEWEFIADTVEFSNEEVPANTMFRSISTDGHITLNNLTPNTEYFYSVRSICAPGDTSSWLATASLRTFCPAYSTPFTENFEDEDATHCWSMIADESDEVYVERVTTNYKSGNASFMSVNASVVTPQLSVDSLTHYMINGWAYAESDSVSFNVGVITDPNDLGTYEQISNIVIPEKNTWTEFVTYFTELADPDYADYKYAQNIVLVCGDNTIYFDDIVIDSISTCPKPSNVNITNVTSNSFDISFVDNAGASEWVVYTNGTPNVITTNPATISNLLATTDYNVSIAAICSATDTSSITDCGIIRTLCGKISTPWICGFEAIEGYIGGTSYDAETSGNLEAHCWNALNQKPNGATYPYGYASTTATCVHTGSQGLTTFTSSAATKNLCLILPDMSDPSNMLKVKFWYKNGGITASYADLKFGYFTDPTDDSSFVSVVTLPKTSAWSEVEILTNITEYNIPANVRLGFVCDKGSSYGYGIYIDDITINSIRNCSDPNNPEVTDITASSATISFVDTCSSHTSWEYVYGSVGFNPNTSTPVAIDSTTFEINGLSSYTTYDVYVRAVCGANDASNYVLARFTTLCDPYSVTLSTPYVDSFEDLAANETLAGCYSVEGLSGTYVMRGYTRNTATYHYALTGDQCLYSYQYYTSVPNGQTAYRQFHLTAGKLYKTSAWVRATSYNGNRAAILFGSEADSDNMTVVTEAFPSACNGVSYDYTSCWQQMSGYISVPVTGDYFIALHADRGASTNTSVYIFFDDFIVEELTGCLPSAVKVDSVTTNTVYAHYTDTDATHTYECMVMNGADTIVAPHYTNSSSFSVNGLPSATSLTLYLRQSCGNGDYSEWSSAAFKTACGVITSYPYTEGFERFAASSKTELSDNCWLVGSTSASAYHYPTTTASYVSEGSKALYIYNTYTAGTIQTFGMPEVDTLAGKTLTMWYKNYGTTETYARLETGYLSDPEDINTFVLLNSSPLTTTYSEISVGYPSSVPAGARPAFRANGTSYMYVDNIEIDYSLPCLAPQNVHIVGDVTEHSAVIAWEGTPDSVEYVLRQGSATIDSAVCQCTTAAYDSLSDGTAYTFLVRSYCAGNTSDWSMLNFQTISLVPECLPAEVYLDSVSANSAYISFAGEGTAQEYEYKVMNGANVVVGSSQVQSNPFTVTGLASDSEYTLYLRHNCENGENSEWDTINFTTECSIISTYPYIEGFESYETSSYTALSDNCWLVSASSEGISHYPTSYESYVHSGSQALYINNSMTSGNVQTFGMPQIDELAGKRLSMWYMNSGYSSIVPALEIGYITADEDGNTFVLLQTAPTSSTYSEYVVDYPISVPDGARPAFRANGANYLYVDDIRINNIVNGNTYSDTICFGEGYYDHGFSCPQGLFAAGDTTLSTVITSTTVGQADSIITVNLHVLPAISTEHYDTICAGQPYNYGLFSIANPESKSYFRTFTSSMGCDSMVTLYLTIVDTYQEMYDTICSGDSYTFNGQQLTISGDYTAYAPNSYGCIDTTMLHLYVVSTRDTVYETICQGSSYTWHGESYTDSGTYTWSGVGQHGCSLVSTLVLNVVGGNISNNVAICAGGYYQFHDTLITTAGTYNYTYYDVDLGCTITETVTVTIDDVISTDVYDIACEGRLYTGYGISDISVNKDTVITISLKTADLCDSISNIHLTYVPTTYSDEHVTIEEGETYEWHETTYSEAGDYPVTLQGTEGCDSIVTLHLTINTGIGNVGTMKIDVIPNPVRPGMTVSVYGDFGDVETVEILNGFGQTVDSFTPNTYPIEIGGLMVEGMYYVRITTRSGEIYTEKLLVKQ